MRTYKDLWKQIEKFMVDNWIDFKSFCYICGIASKELTKISEGNYDLKKDPTCKKIKKVLKFFNKKKVKLETRFVFCKLSCKGKSIDMTDTSIPIINYKSTN